MESWSNGKIQTVIALAFIVWLCAGLCGLPLFAQERVRMALSVRNVVFLPFYYARDAKIFDKHQLNVELIQMRRDLQLAGLVFGEIDFTPSVGPAAAAIANSLPVKALGALIRTRTNRDSWQRNDRCRFIYSHRRTAGVTEV